MNNLNTIHRDWINQNMPFSIAVIFESARGRYIEAAVPAIFHFRAYKPLLIITFAVASVDTWVVAPLNVRTAGLKVKLLAVGENVRVSPLLTARDSVSCPVVVWPAKEEKPWKFDVIETVP